MVDVRYSLNHIYSIREALVHLLLDREPGRAELLKAEEYVRDLELWTDALQTEIYKLEVEQ